MDQQLEAYRTAVQMDKPNARHDLEQFQVQRQAQVTDILQVKHSAMCPYCSLAEYMLYGQRAQAATRWYDSFSAKQGVTAGLARSQRIQE